MATISTAENFDLQRLARFVSDDLPAFQRLLFVRLPEEEIAKTSTFKFQKVKARTERFNPGVVSDPLYYLINVDQSTFEGIESGKIVPG